MNKLNTILLVEDNPMDVELTLEAFKDHELANQVSVANDGVEAMEYLRYEGKFEHREKGNPAVIFLDIKMPRMDGIEALKAIRSDDKLKFIPVVMLTSSREEKDLKKCYELGVNGYVVKPVDYKEFNNAVKQLGVVWAMLNELPSQTGS